MLLPLSLIRLPEETLKKCCFCPFLSVHISPSPQLTYSITHLSRDSQSVLIVCGEKRMALKNIVPAAISTGTVLSASAGFCPKHRCAAKRTRSTSMARRRLPSTVRTKPVHPKRLASTSTTPSSASAWRLRLPARRPRRYCLVIDVTAGTVWTPIT
jgi:hypothetical protein